MRTLILGYGISGKGSLKLLEQRNIPTVLFDDSLKAQEEILKDGKNLLLQNSILLDEIAQIVVSPGVSPLHPILKNAEKLRIPIMSDIELALSTFPGRFVGITGTNGKTTTCHMLHFLLTEVGVSAKLTGNYGTSICDTVLSADKNDVLIVELSSFQLHYTKKLQSYACAFVNFNDDHLDWHHGRKNYFSSKWKIFELAPPGILRILTPSVSAEALAQLKPPLHPDNCLVLDGQNKDLSPDFFQTTHDRLNAEIASHLAADITGARAEFFFPFFKRYKKLPHRFEIFLKKEGRLFINDSKGTNLDATISALQNTPSPLILFLGGIPKDPSFEPLRAYSDKIIKIIIFGQGKEAIRKDLSPFFSTKVYDTLHQALEQTQTLLCNESAHVLFSPACASMDEFSNYQHRGVFFKETVLDFFR